MATDPEDSVITKIAAMAAWTENTNLFKGPLRPVDDTATGLIPQVAVFVQYFGGPRPINFTPNGYTLQELEHNVQILIRGEPKQYGSTRTLAEAIYEELHDRAPAGYFYWRADQSAPLLVDEDERGAYLFVINMRVGILE